MPEKKKTAVPRLRFPEFRDAGPWEVKRLGDVAEIITGNTPSTSEPSNYDGDKLFVSPADISDDRYVENTKTTLSDIGFSTSRRIPPSSVLFVCIGSIGKVAQNRFECATNQQINSLLALSSVANDFLYYVLDFNSKKIAGIAGNQVVPIISKSLFSSVQVPIPSLPEQQKIADCLSSLDDLIRAEEAVLDAWKGHKKGLMQQLFPREGETTPRLRFPEFRNAGPWEVKRLGELATKRTERNKNGHVTRVLTNSAENGVVDQREYFKKDIAVQGNLGNYFVVHKDDFVYNPRISAAAPVGPISRNNIATGVMSPLYTVFFFRDSGTDFFLHYFGSSAWHSYMRSVGSTGARHDRMALSDKDFFTMPVPNPPKREQQKIADCLSSLDDLIRAQGERIEALKQHKKGLMQQLFPQEVA